MPFLTGYTKRKEIKYGTVFPGSNLTDFPKLFIITTDADIAAELSSNNGIAVTEDDGETLVPFGLYPSTNGNAGTLVLRAKFPTLLAAASTGDTLGYLYYDSGQTTSEDKAGVVDNGYLLFMPLEEDPSGGAPQMYDWVSEANVGTSAGSMTSGDSVAGLVGNALDFDGSDDSVSVPGSILSGTSGTMTIEAWVKASSYSDYTSIFDTSSRQASLFASSNSGAWYWEFSGGGTSLGSGSSLGTGSWQHLAITTAATGSTGKVYHNGSLRDTSLAVGSTFNQTLHFGANPSGGGALLTGQRDEVRISSVARSAAWLAYAYQDDLNNDDTFSLGAEESEGGEEFDAATFPWLATPAWPPRRPARAVGYGSFPGVRIS